MQVIFLLLTSALAVSVAISYELLAAVLYFLGAVLVWLCSYQAISGLMYGRGKARAIIPIVQIALTASGFALLFLSNASLKVLSLQLTAVQYGYVALGLGVFLAFTSRPPQDEISAVQQNAGGQLPPQSEVSIIQAFGGHIENHAPLPGCVADASQLPFPKKTIKDALIVGLKNNADPNIKEMLKVAFLQLADWQEGVGDSDKGLDPTKINSDDAVEIAKKIASQTSGLDPWTRLVADERESLERELKDLSLW